MKHIIATFLVAFATLAAVAQPPARRAAEERQNAQSASRTATSAAKTNLTGAAYRDFPTAQVMPDDAAWRRDIYRELDLTKDANATLYYPTTPQGGRRNLFCYLFYLIMRGQVKAYEYTLDGNEHFEDKYVEKGRKIMDRHNIFYEVSDDNKIRLNDADLPSEDVKIFYIKESVYYDQHTASFRTKVTALCPVIKRGDSEFGGSDQKYPMFWVNYEEAAPYLAKLMLMGSNLNNASAISADDYFTLNRYEGDIYKTTNLQDRILSADDDSARVREQKIIEKQLTDFEDHVWGHDSVPEEQAEVMAENDSIVAEAQVSTVTTRRTVTPRRTTVKAKSAKAPKSSSSAPKSSATEKSKRSTTKVSRSSGRSGGSLSVRRERH